MNEIHKKEVLIFCTFATSLKIKQRSCLKWKKAPRQDISFIEFIALIALLMALTAFTIDAVLPALKIIGQDLGQTEANNNQLIISVFFTGLAFGQLLYGPLSDS